MPKKTNHVIMRHVLEVRLDKRLFSFLDFKGQMVDLMSDALATNQIRISQNGSRFDIATDTYDEIYFFSVENFGFQLELVDHFDSFISTSKNLLDKINELQDYTWESQGIARLGTKSTILFHKRHEQYGTLKSLYKDSFVQKNTQLAELTKSEIIDTGHIFELKLPDCKANIMTGPVTKTEALQKFYNNYGAYADKFSPDNGMIFVADIHADNPSSLKSKEQLIVAIESQVKAIEQVFNGFCSHIWANDNE